MANSVNVNEKVQVPDKKKGTPFSVKVNSDTYKNLINQTLGNPDRAANFVASITSAVATNPMLQECDAGTIVSAGLLGETLQLSPSPQLGHFYLVPYNDKKRGKVAQFQLGYKGYIQLAIRSGQYKKLNVLAIKEGELNHYDPLNEEIDVTLIENDAEREKAETIGYYAMFEYINGFRKAIYWSKEKMENHAKTYSASYRSHNGSFWDKDFDAMAFKTMLRQLISKWGVMSVDFQNIQKAFDADMAVIDEKNNYDYVDNSDFNADVDNTPFADNVVADVEPEVETDQAETSDEEVK